MIKVIFADAKKEIVVRREESILKIANRGRVVLKHRCGGNGSCATCKVIISDQTAVSPPNAIEHRLLGPRLAHGYRLACQTKVRGTLRVSWPVDPMKAAVRAQLERMKREEE